MLKDLLAESAKQFEQRFGVNGPIDNTYTMGCDCHPKTEQILSFLSSQISSAFALGEEQGIKKASKMIEDGYEKALQNLTVRLNKKLTDREIFIMSSVLVNIRNTLDFALQSNLTTHKD